ncbi:CHAT domain-containing protein [Tardiphaga sp. 538_B7_N1_4]|uniref:CHAT domain-containing protein n=1 Tax=Tardiphaga sp. 538_B7_N1_4 TaxID=3240778 RepID=UPI003F276641
MTIDPTIYFIVVVPDWNPQEATPPQGFALSLCMMSWAVRCAAQLPSNVLDLSEEGQKNLVSRRMSGIYPVHWFGQSPRAIRSIPFLPIIPFSLIILPESESASDYKEWADSSPFRPTIVAKSGGDLTYEALTIDGLQKHFLEVCDRLPADIDSAEIEQIRTALKEWKPMPARSLGYQVEGHNSVAPNLVALGVAGFSDMVSGPFRSFEAGLQGYVGQIVKTSNTILDERDAIEPRDMHRIFRLPPDVNLFAPAIAPGFFEAPSPPNMDREEKRRFTTVRHALERQTGYGFELRTDGQVSAFVGKSFVTSRKKEDGETHPLMHLRARELSLSTEVMSAVAASEFSAVVRLPNDINRTAGSTHRKAEINLKHVQVTSEAELIKALNEFQGPLVVFDGHGSHGAGGPGKLHLGDEAVDIWSLTDKITNMPPIVVLSACDTHAADRNHATTANGFMSLGARTVLSSVFPLDARQAAVFTARLVLRVSDFLRPAIMLSGQALTWQEVISGMLRMQLLSDFLRLLRSNKKIDDETYKKVHVDGNFAINGGHPDPFGVVIKKLEELGVTGLALDLESAVANSSVISYLQIGRPATSNLGVCV